MTIDIVANLIKVLNEKIRDDLHSAEFESIEIARKLMLQPTRQLYINEVIPCPC